jgi:glycosyltransferase involved in cell wall biosynthesis
VSFGAQRNWSLDHCQLKHPWVLFLDADEVSNKEFVRAAKQAILEAPDTTAGFYCCWRQLYENRWLKRCDSFPKWQFRLMRRGRARFTDYGHGQKEGEVQGKLEYIPAPYDHHFLSKGMGYWLDRHNRYSGLEAIARLSEPVNFWGIFSWHGSRRNKALKPFVSRCPGWPLIRFFISYVLRLGFLEGRPGFVYCVNMAYYEFLIRLKMREEKLKRAEMLHRSVAAPEAVGKKPALDEPGRNGTAGISPTTPDCLDYE